MTRDVANWFHDRDGELFTVDETPFTREEIVQVVNDSVDPIQQVMVEGEKYIGVISFEEHDGWYEYTRWDDSAREVTIGVCAKCVEEAEYVDEVSRTIDDSTDVARQKFDHHYEEDHEVRPDEVNTGATLLSGTTINGNEAIHPGMDGSGSGVDADFVLGNEALQTGSFYSFNKGIIISKFLSPGSRARGVGISSDDSIWHSDSDSDSIYELNQNGTIQSQFSSPCTFPTDIGFDSSDSIWHSDNDANSIYQLNQLGSEQSKFSSPSSGPIGLSVDLDNSIWNADRSGDSIYELNQSGTIQSQFSSPCTFPRGLGVDLNNSLWHVEGIGSVYQLDQNGAIQKKFKLQRANVSPQGLDIDSNGSVWNADDSDDSIYELTQGDEFIQF